jgi:hypothetical protein
MPQSLNTTDSPNSDQPINPTPESQRRLSEKQLAANRANASKSTGPRTPEGKARSSQNARKHGFAAASFSVVRLEPLDALANLRADLIAAYQPVNSQELFALERIALAQQNLLRIAALEAGLLTSALDRAVDRHSEAPLHPLSEDLLADLDLLRSQNRHYALAEGFRQMVTQSDVWRLFLRYQAQTERLYRRAIEEFDRLKARRAELPNEPVEDQPAPPEPLADHPVRPEPSHPIDPELAARILTPYPFVPDPPKPLTEPQVILGGVRQPSKPPETPHQPPVTR